MRTEKLRVEDLMSTALITMKPNQTVAHAEAEMRLANIRHIPVVSEHEHLVGIVSDRDVGRAAGAGALDAPIAEIMTRHIKAVPASAPASRAAALMIDHKIGALPVLGERGQLVGIITETDFLEIAYRALGGRAGTEP